MIVQRRVHLAPEHLHQHAQVYTSLSHLTQMGQVRRKSGENKKDSLINKLSIRNLEPKFCNKTRYLLVPGAGIEPARDV